MRTRHFPGTHRTRPPAETWEAIRPLLPAYGITRVADVTGLDDLGIPVTMAVRPLGRTLSVAQGKGLTLAAARVSGAMEGIEVWHAERALPAPMAHAPAADLDLPYPVAALEPHPGSLVTDHTVMEWITATALTDHRPVPVPAASVRLGRQEHSTWRLHLPSASTNGLASGNTRAEAIVHALYELIERETVSNLATGAAGAGAQRLDAASICDPHLAELVDRLERAGCWHELWHLPNSFGVPVMCCYLWREDIPALQAAGSGAHLDASVALARAITEAAQTRLTQITGSREDIHPAAYRPGASVGQPQHAGPAPVAWAHAVSHHRGRFDDDEQEAAHLSDVVAARTGAAPLAVDLTHGPWQREDLAVIKVLAPHLRYTARHVIPHPHTAGREQAA
ncbi:YcaO-like family protein [Streptomyces synnematoformans]|uniref:YcaO-like family protein n=1 Tax=Streptomyces synnematoformans TaxID=415721 RepID=A0ABP5J2Q8_9ACTN